MLNNYYRLCAILPGILLTNTFISGERAEAQREKLQGERIRERTQTTRTISANTSTFDWCYWTCLSHIEYRWHQARILSIHSS
jgi:hypothetical protein